jgi:hypothetical protein
MDQNERRLLLAQQTLLPPVENAKRDQDSLAAFVACYFLALYVTRFSVNA